MAKMQAWNVYVGKHWIDTVFYTADMFAEDVRRSLVDHDGYRSDITVSRDNKLYTRRQK